MFENINDLTISGGIFGNGTMLEGIFKDRINILYGPNGSGKSTISRAIYDICHPGEPKTGAAEALFSDEERNLLSGSLYVFNEDFVDRNIKVSIDGLETVVMLGDDVKNDDKKDDIVKQLTEKQKEYDGKYANCYITANSSSKTYDEQIKEKIDSIKDKLNSPNGYADRAGKIKGNKGKIRTIDMSVFNGLSNNPDIYKIDIAALSKELDEGIWTLQKTKEGNGINWNADISKMIDVDAVNQLLLKVIPKVELNDAKIQEIANTSLNLVSEAKKNIIDKEIDFCPYCQRPISDEWLEKLKENIKNILNKDTEDFSVELSEMIASTLDVEFIYPDEIDGIVGQEVKDVKLAMLSFNSYLKDIRLALEEKKNNMYSPSSTIDKKTFSDTYYNYATAIGALNLAINNYNECINNRRQLVADLNKKNEILAVRDNITDFKEIDRLNTQKDKDILALGNLHDEITKLNNEIKKINESLSDTKAAQNFINFCLKNVFLEENRLSISYSEKSNKFVLKSRNTELVPKHISIGERNILALSYFFAKLFENTKKGERFKKNMFVIIDDPISSFDLGNIVGVTAIFNYVLHEIFPKFNQKSSKVLVMTHDRQTVKYFESIRDDLIYKPKEYKWKSNELFNYENCMMIVSYSEWKDDYTTRLERIRDFATSIDFKEKDQNKIRAFYEKYNSIGNQIRQAVESFARMNYNLDCKKVLDGDTKIWEDFKFNRGVNIPQNEITQRQKALKLGISKYLLRVVLNEASHAGTNVDVENNVRRYDLKELRTMARCFLAFIDCVAPRHSYGYLRRGEGYEDNTNHYLMNNLVEELSNQFMSEEL